MKIGSYEVEGLLGRGGMGVVYRGRSMTGEAVAIKVLPRTDSERLARFERERRLLGAFTARDGFVPLLDAGLSNEGPYLVMPLLAGGTLRERLERGVLGVEETVALGRTLASALGRAHARGIVHRDVKPENVLHDAGGEPLLADLGLAKHWSPEAPGASQSVSLSRHGVARGTVGYMAPEQIEDAKSAGPRADVFALGAVLYECLTGTPVFSGANVIELLAEMEAPSRRSLQEARKDAPGWLARVVERALSREPRERFADGSELARALAEPRRRPWTRPGALVVATLGAVGTVALLAGRAAMRPTAGPVAPGGKTSSSSPPRTARQDLSLEELKRHELERLDASDWAGAIADATKIVELEPSFAPAWANRGRARDKLGDLDGAIADDTKAIQLDATLALVWHNRGVARGQKGELDGVISDETRAIELEPTLAVAWQSRGWARGEKGDWEGAIDDETRAIELAPTLSDSWHYRAWARGQKGDLDGEIDDETRAIELAPALATAWEGRGWARGQKGDFEGEIADETKAIELAPALATAWENRAVARGNKGNHDGVIADATRAIELAPGRPFSWNLRAIARDQKGDVAGAISDYERFLELAPSEAEASPVRERLAELRARR